MIDTSLAIQAAVEGNWEKAIKVNKEIIKSKTNDVDALNRLGFAYLQCGQTKKAQQIFNKVLKIDPFNPIALKNLKKIKNSKLLGNVNQQKICPDVFLEEPGITKTVNLINLASKSVLSLLVPSQKVLLITKKNRVEVRSIDNIYLGALPDDLSFRLKKLMRLGNIYCAFIKSVEEQKLTIIIREIKRSRRVKDASFSISNSQNYNSSFRSELLAELIEEDESAELSADEE